MEVDSSTTVRPYHDADIPALVELFARVFGGSITAEHWRWKLQANPAPGCAVWLAVAGTRPVFQYAGIAQRYCIAGREIIGMVSVDTMTDPEFRRRGLLTRVANEAYASWRKAGAAFVIGLPNQQWGSRTTALGWVELFPLQWLARPLRPAAFMARRLKLPWIRHTPFVDAAWNRLQRRHVPPGSAGVVEVEHADASFDELWSRVRGEYRFSAIRDSAWVNWRFLASPLRRYQVLAARDGQRTSGYLAYAITKTAESATSHLAELITAPGDLDVRDRLLGEYAERMIALGVEKIVTLAAPGTAHTDWLSRRGFFRGPGFSVQLVPLADDLPLDQMKDPRAWLLNGADFDVI